MHSIVCFKFKLPFTVSLLLLLTERLQVTLWREAGPGGPGEETVLLDTDDPDHQYSHLLLVETNQHCHLVMARISLKLSYHI